MSELPDKVWWYTENDGDPRSVTMEPEGGGLTQSSQSCQKAALAAHIMRTYFSRMQCYSDVILGSSARSSERHALYPR